LALSSGSGVGRVSGPDVRSAAAALRGRMTILHLLYFLGMLALWAIVEGA